MSDAVQLPNNVRPIKYFLTLVPDLGSFTFRGDETIEIEVLEPTSTIVLNADELSIQSAQIIPEVHQPHRAKNIVLDAASETARLEFDDEIPLGPARLHIQFTGELNDKLRGFYRSRYTDSQGQERWMASTQFEASDARRAFPCWDEPGLKARFQLTMVVPRDLTVISNTPVEAELDAGHGMKQVRFQETPPMSTYLLAFVVGDLAFVEQRHRSGTLMRVWATRGREHQGRFALETSLRILDYMNDYFGIPYPLPKLDHVAIPDFAAGAMENWGCITYRETALLVDPENSPAATRQRVAEVVAHEMAHMWFGDLVTMRWWNDLWLNESFASWMGTKTVDNLFPQWDMWTQFLDQDTMRALGLDGLKNSHPIEVEVKTPGEIRELFDEISYSKGAAILRMLEQFLGPEVFQRGIQRYLSQHIHGNATTADLWAALEEVSGQPVGRLMDSWVKQTGYPVVEVVSRRQRGGLALELSQKRFLYSHLIGEGQDDQTLWSVPLGVVTSWQRQPVRHLMEERKATLRLKGAPPADGRAWLKVNPLQTGFYRTLYQPQDWERLLPAVASLELPAADRLGIQNDAYALCKAGYISADQFLTVAAAYTNEVDFSVWSDLSGNLRAIHNLTFGDPYHDKLRAFARELFRPIAQKVGWQPREGEGHLDALLRSTVLGSLGGYGDEATLATARELFQAYLRDKRAVHPDLRGVVFSLAAEGGDGDTYAALKQLYKEAALQEEKVRFLVALTRFNDRPLLQQTLEYSLTPEVRAHDTVTVLVSTAGNPQGRDMAWEFLKANWPEFDRRYGQGGFAIMRIVGIARGFSTEERYQDVEQFFATHPVPAAARTVRQSLEQIRLNMKWLEKNRPALERYFSGR